MYWLWIMDLGHELRDDDKFDDFQFRVWKNYKDGFEGAHEYISQKIPIWYGWNRIEK